MLIREARFVNHWSWACLTSLSSTCLPSSLPPVSPTSPLPTRSFITVLKSLSSSKPSTIHHHACAPVTSPETQPSWRSCLHFLTSRSLLTPLPSGLSSLQTTEMFPPKSPQQLCSPPRGDASIFTWLFAAFNTVTHPCLLNFPVPLETVSVPPGLFLLSLFLFSSVPHPFPILCRPLRCWPFPEVHPSPSPLTL